MKSGDFIGFGIFAIQNGGISWDSTIQKWVKNLVYLHEICGDFQHLNLKKSTWLVHFKKDDEPLELGLL